MLRKKLALSLVTVSALAILASCSAGAVDTDAGDNTLVVWSFNENETDTHLCILWDSHVTDYHTLLDCHRELNKNRRTNSTRDLSFTGIELS
ncbi:hypothetical protein GCM10008932_03920 [Alkalibacterium iburiense]|uniref:Uncharacterized protein n=1 Tax=Alkalibacterium iburiense TaxID=290589 RepID=A0ABP3GT11_9LACT